jgi:hypothetical protein
MATKLTNSLTTQDLYAENGSNYRFFLNWRHALFAGYLLILFTLANIYFTNNQFEETNRPYLYVVVLVSSLIFWGLERRIRNLYHACMNTGHALEKAIGTNGIYTRLDGPEMRGRWPTHSTILDGLFGGTSLLMVIVLVCELVA